MRSTLKRIADETIAAIDHRSYTLDDTTYDLDLDLDQQTLYFPPDSTLSQWSSSSPTPTADTQTDLSILQLSTLQASRLMADSTQRKIGILNFASAKNPGGGFLRGAQAQEESIARSSTLYPTLITDTAKQFYALHRRNPKGGYYSHAMVYSPRVVLFRDYDGAFLHPLQVDVLTSPAVNAGVVRRTLHGRVAGRNVEVQIERAMRERMARILYLFETQHVRDVVLGSFGTGVFRNNVAMVARIWADLIGVDGARFKMSLDRVVFAILDTFREFKQAFEGQTITDEGNEVNQALVVDE